MMSPDMDLKRRHSQPVTVVSLASSETSLFMFTYNTTINFSELYYCFLNASSPFILIEYCNHCYVNIEINSSSFTLH